jgi:hypothetical protein
MLTPLLSPEQVSEAAAGLGLSRTATAWRRAAFRPSPRLSRVCFGGARRISRDRCRNARVAVTEPRTSCQSPAKRTIHRAGNLLA